MPCAETMVTVSCDAPHCPERDLTIAVALERTDDVPDVRIRARAAAVDNATAKGWLVQLDGPALCPLHAHPRTVLA